MNQTLSRTLAAMMAGISKCSCWADTNCLRVSWTAVIMLVWKRQSGLYSIRLTAAAAPRPTGWSAFADGAE